MADALSNQRRTRTLWVLGALWVILAVVAVLWAVDNAESDIEGRAAAALAEAGVSGVDIDVQGRDIVLAAPSLGRDELSATVAMLQGLNGVREVRVAQNIAGGGDPPPGETSTTSSPAATSTTTPPADTTTTTSTTTTTTTTVPAAGSETSLTATLSQGVLTVSGQVPSEEVASGIAQVGGLIFDPLFTSEVTVDATLPPTPWLAGAPRAIAVLPIIGEGTITLAGATATIDGETGVAAKAEAMAGAVAQALGPDVEVVNQVEVTGKAPASYTAVAPGDGTVILGGTLPSQEAVDLLVNSVSDAFGPENVINEMVIDDGVEATFSLYRLPFVYPALAPIPIWQIDIQNDVITGALQGGATFAFGSAELTPQLEGLATIAAGILLRNPTLGIVVEGHTDSIGSQEFNLRLSQDRAEAATAFIQSLGVEPERLTAVGRGETEPIADNATEEGRAQNRRIDFVLGPAQGAGS